MIDVIHETDELKRWPTIFIVGRFFDALFCLCKNLLNIIHKIQIIIVIHAEVVGNDTFSNHMPVFLVAVDHDNYLLGTAVAGSDIPLPQGTYNTAFQNAHGIVQVADFQSAMNIFGNGKQNDLRILFISA